MDPALGLALAVAAGAVVVATVAKLAAELCAAGTGGDPAKPRDDGEAGRETTRKWAVVEMPDGNAALARKL